MAKDTSLAGRERPSMRGDIADGLFPVPASFTPLHGISSSNVPSRMTVISHILGKISLALSR